jgi:hypothetical protein
MEIGGIATKKISKYRAFKWKDQNYIICKIEKPKIQLNLNITLLFFSK